VANPDKWATATVKQPLITSNISIVVVPSNAVVLIGQSQQFTAVVQGDPSNAGVTWQIGSGNPSNPCVPAICGTISPTGLYTAPASVAGPTSIVVQATAVADPGKVSTARVTVVAAPLVSISISPGSATVQAGFSQQFTAQVQNDPSNAGVTWSVRDTTSYTDFFDIAYTCSDSNSCGTINANGLYTAPATRTFPGFARIMATSATAAIGQEVWVYIVPAPTAISVSPSGATVQNNGSQQFTAGGLPEGVVPVVTWSVSGAGCSGTDCGTIGPDGQYLAPAIPPTPPVVTVTAISVADASVNNSVAVMLGANPNNAKLNGQYAFLIDASDLVVIFGTRADDVLAGSFTADGNGNILGGVLDGILWDAADSFWSGSSLRILGGSYSVGPDDRGSATLLLDNVFYPYSFSFALGSFAAGVADRGQLGGGVSAGAGRTHEVTGVLARQDPTAFTNNAIAGDYAFGLSVQYELPSWAPDSDIKEAVGEFTLNGGVIGAGQTDVLYFSQPSGASIPLSFVGTYNNVDARGRSTALLSFNGSTTPFPQLVFYVVSPSELLVLETGHSLTGSALRKFAGSFSAASLGGPAAIARTDPTYPRSSSDLGVYLTAFDGTGTWSGASDLVDSNGVVTPTPFTGTYSADADGLGRGVLYPLGPQFPVAAAEPFYFVAPGKAFVLGLGTLEAQPGAPFSNTSFSGSYTVSLYDDPPSTSGVITADGAGGLSGAADGVNGNGGSLGTTFTGVYSVGANGRGTLTTIPSTGTPVNWILYVVSPSKVLLRKPEPYGRPATIQK
jgi:hypothetical protein